VRNTASYAILPLTHNLTRPVTQTQGSSMRRAKPAEPARPKCAKRVGRNILTFRDRLRTITLPPELMFAQPIRVFDMGWPATREQHANHNGGMLTCHGMVAAEHMRVGEIDNGMQCEHQQSQSDGPRCARDLLRQSPRNHGEVIFDSFWDLGGLWVYCAQSTSRCDGVGIDLIVEASWREERVGLCTCANQVNHTSTTTRIKKLKDCSNLLNYPLVSYHTNKSYFPVKRSDRPLVNSAPPGGLFEGHV
jgi:hypothetical protein